MGGEVRVAGGRDQRSRPRGGQRRAESREVTDGGRLPRAPAVLAAKLPHVRVAVRPSDPDQDAGGGLVDGHLVVAGGVAEGSRRQVLLARIRVAKHRRRPGAAVVLAARCHGRHVLALGRQDRLVGRAHHHRQDQGAIAHAYRRPRTARSPLARPASGHLGVGGTVPRASSVDRFAGTQRLSLVLVVDAQAHPGPVATDERAAQSAFIRRGLGLSPRSAAVLGADEDRAPGLTVVGIAEGQVERRTSGTALEQGRVALVGVGVGLRAGGNPVLGGRRQSVPGAGRSRRSVDPQRVESSRVGIGCLDGAEADPARSVGVVLHVGSRDVVDPRLQAPAFGAHAHVVPTAQDRAQAGHHPEAEIALQRRAVRDHHARPARSRAKLLAAERHVEGVETAAVLQAEQEAYRGGGAQAKPEGRLEVPVHRVVSNRQVLDVGAVGGAQRAARVLRPSPAQKRPSRSIRKTERRPCV